MRDIKPSVLSKILGDSVASKLDADDLSPDF
jgi:hypothetical protein